MSATADGRRVPISLGQERARAERDARYRANLACGVKQLRALLAIILTVSSLTLGWPVAPSTLVRRAVSPIQATLCGPTPGRPPPRR